MTTVLILSSFTDRKVDNDKTILQKLQTFDWIGTIFFVSAIVCLLLALQWGSGQYQWQNGRIIAWLVFFGALLAAFVTSQYLQGNKASVPGRIICQRSMICGAIYLPTLSGALEMMAYFVGVSAAENASPVGVFTLMKSAASMVSSCQRRFTTFLGNHELAIGSIPSGFVYHRRNSSFRAWKLRPVHDWRKYLVGHWMWAVYHFHTINWSCPLDKLRSHCRSRHRPWPEVGVLRAISFDSSVVLGREEE